MNRTALIVRIRTKEGLTCTGMLGKQVVPSQNEYVTIGMIVGREKKTVTFLNTGSTYMGEWENLNFTFR